MSAYPFFNKPIPLTAGAVLVTLLISLVFMTGARADSPPLGWQQSNTSGFGTPENSAIGALSVFEDQLYAGSWNENGAEVWRSEDGQSWTEFTPNWSVSNIEVSCARPFGNHLYVGTGNMSGGEIWRTDGTSWKKVAQGGLGDANNYNFSACTVFKNALYTATGNIPPAIGGTGNGVEVWRSFSGASGSWVQVNSDGFGAGPTWTDITMEVYQGYLYVGLSRVTPSNGALAELWRSKDGTNWTPVFTDGLGEAGNTHLSAMAEFEGELYIAMRNSTTGGQVWRSADGLNWTPVFTDGLGNLANSRPYGLIVYANRLIVIFSNVATGAEVWWTADGESWQQIATGGWGDSNNGFADYFDKAADIFHESLYIGTLNNADGGEIWRRLHLANLPVIVRP